MSSKTSAGSPPEFFVDRNLGKVTADRLRASGWQLHLIADEYEDDAKNVTDVAWITHGCQRGWSLLTKDKAIRYRAKELDSLAPHSLLFCLAGGNLKIDDMVEALNIARPRIEREIAAGNAGFWHVYNDGRLNRMWAPGDDA